MTWNPIVTFILVVIMFPFVIIGSIFILLRIENIIKKLIIIILMTFLFAARTIINFGIKKGYTDLDEETTTLIRRANNALALGERILGDKE